MFESQILLEEGNLLTPKIIQSYSDVRLISETSLYHLYEGKKLDFPYSIHTIRAFDFNSKFAIEDFDAAASLFIKELLHLISVDPKCVSVNTFEISDGGRKMAFAALPYTPLCCQIQEVQGLKSGIEERKQGDTSLSGFNDIKCIEALIADVLMDVEFLSKELLIKDCSSILIPQNIYKFKDSGAYFIGDWLTAVMSERLILTETQTITTTPEQFREMLSLGLSILELNGVDSKIIKELREMKDKEDISLFNEVLEGILSDVSGLPKEVKKLLERMLNSNLNIRPQFEELIRHLSRVRRIRAPKGITELDITSEASWLTAKKNQETIATYSKEKTHGLDTLPTLSICMDSLLSLNNPKLGWSLFYPDYEKYETLKDKMLIWVAVIGIKDVGKSWFCNRLAESDVFSFGYNQSTRSLDFLFPSEKQGSSIGIIDTPSCNEPIQVIDEELFKLVDCRDEEKHKKNFKILKKDAKITQHLKERFIREITDILVVVCNKLSEREQEMLYNVIGHHKKISKDRLEDASKSKSGVRETTLIIVHNFKNYSTKEQVQNQIKKDLSKSFRVEEWAMYSESAIKFKDLNQTMYRDQFGILHLILACEGTEAGDYYNRTTFSFLRSRLSTLEHMTQMDIPRALLEFCNRNLPRILEQDIRLKLDISRTAIVKDEESEVIALENLQCDECRNFSFMRSSFDPRYSISEKILSDTKRELIVEVEVLNSKFKSWYKRHLDGVYYLTMEGRKDVLAGNDANAGVKNLDNNRESGDFKLKIPLSDEVLASLRKEPKEGKSQDGIVRYIFIFEKDEQIEI